VVRGKGKESGGQKGYSKDQKQRELISKIIGHGIVAERKRIKSTSWAIGPGEKRGGKKDLRVRE